MATAQRDGSVLWRCQYIADELELSDSTSVLQYACRAPVEFTGALEVATDSLTTLGTLACLSYLKHGLCSPSRPTNQEGTAQEDAVLSWDTLHTHDGVQNPRIYVAVRGTVFDVTDKGKDFYGPGAGYSVLAGHDATQNLSKMSLERSDLDCPSYVPVDDDEQSAIDGWDAKFRSKYPIVGKIQGQEHPLDAMFRRMQNDIVQACQRVVCDTQPQSGAAGAGGGNAFAPNVLGVGDIFAHVFASGKCLRPEVLGTDPSARCLMGLLAAPVAAWERAFASAGSTSQKGGVAVSEPTRRPMAAGHPDVSVSVPPAVALVDAYDFEADSVFQAGLHTVIAKLAKTADMSPGAADTSAEDSQAIALIKARAFYFNKCVRHIDSAAYIGWKLRERQLRSLDEAVASGPGGVAPTDKHPEPSAIEPLHATAAPTTDTVPSPADTAEKVLTASGESGAASEKKKLTFDEVMAYVAQGKEVPGCRKVTVEVQDDVAPSPSLMQCPPKPWETAAP
eukprot:m.67303 g.67303  ORF g.67303 m.67303 type:complete len:506 (+) comp15972_c0_seq1:147-1664(+)